jgi:hypothetical protein
MKLLQVDEFIKMFKTKPITFADFLLVAQVRTSAGLVPLKEYMKRRNLDRSALKPLFENIERKDEYLTRFYTLSLRVPEDGFHIRDTPMKNKQMNNNELSLYKNIIRNMHFKNILQDTQSGIEGVPTFLNVIKDLYTKYIIDYKIITPSALHYIKEGRLGSVYSSFYFRASIMNPYLTYSLNKSVLKGTRIFTPTLGWSSYCLGFLECDEVVEYVGTDVIPEVCSKTLTYASEHYPDKKTTIYCQPSEKLARTPSFLNKYKGHFDVVFFSPPYYKLELYPGKDQSTDQYTSYEEWLKEYWEQTIRLCKHVLSAKGKLCYILSGYGSENTREQYDLLTDMNAITKKYFTLKSTQPMYNKDVHVTKHKDTAEKIMIFQTL